MLHAGEGSVKGRISGSIVGENQRGRYGGAARKEPLDQQLSVVSADESDPALVAADRPVLERGVRVRPFLIDEFVAVDEARDLLKRPAFAAQIERDECIPMACRLDCPFTFLTTETSAPIEVSEPSDQPLAAFDIGELIDNELQLEGIDTDFLADAPDLGDPPSVPQK